MKKFFFWLSLVSALVFTHPVFAQPATPMQWYKQLQGNSGFGQSSKSMVVDSAGNSYITGACPGGSTDFDPGPGIFILSSSSNQCIYILKLDAAGNFVWAKSFDSSPSYLSTGIGNAISLDRLGNIYITGKYTGTFDFDPGAGSYTLATGYGCLDIFVAKLDAQGNFKWAGDIGSSYCGSYGLGIAIDKLGNSYTTGVFYGGADFDPGPATYSLNSVGNFSNVFILKLDSSGNFKWAHAMGSTAMNLDCYGTCITVDNKGMPVVSGNFYGTVDFDPGPGTFSMSSTNNNGYDIFIVKFDTVGNFTWAKKLGGIGADQVCSIASDTSGNIYTTGAFEATVDFDPGNAVFNLTSAGMGDIFISKLDSTGGFVWAKRIGGVNAESGFYLVTDAAGSVYSTGAFQFSNVDFDPGSGVYILNTLQGANNIYYLKLNSLGNFVWAKTTGGTSNGFFNSGIARDFSGSIYGTGATSGGVNFEPSNSSFISTNVPPYNFFNVFIIKFIPCDAPSQQIAVSGANVCAGDTATLSANGAATYTWSTGALTSTVMQSSAASVYSVAGTTTLGCVSNATVQLLVKPLPVISVNSGSVCAGQSFSIVAAGASSYSYSGGSALVTPTTTSAYSVTGTSNTGCASSQPAVAQVTVYSLPLISLSNGSICAGQSFSIVATGALSYTYSGGSAIVSPVSTSSYSVSGNNAAGCTAQAVTQVTVNALPVINITSSSGTICAGQNATLTATGAGSYSWSTGMQAIAIAVSPLSNITYTVIGTDINGCTATDSLTEYVSKCTDIASYKTSSLPSIFPNPFNTELNLVFNSSDITDPVLLYNASGCLVLQAYLPAGASQLILSLGMLDKGLYIIRVGAASQKIVRE